MIDFALFTSRFDDTILQELLGASALKLVSLLDPTLASRANLCRLAVDLYSPEGLFLSKTTRSLLFDLLTPEEAEQLATMLAVKPCTDIYFALKRLALRRGSIREQTVFRFFSLEPPPIEELPLASVKTAVNSEYALFPYQRHAARQIQGYLRSQRKRVVLHMPTGSGKTRTAINIIVEHLRVHEPTIVIWLAHSQELCEQASTEFEKAWTFLGNRPLALYRFWENREVDIATVSDGFFVAGLAKMYQSIKKDIQFLTHLGRHCTLVIIDEAHSAVADTYRLILDALVVQRQSTSLLGLTATPGRTWLDIDADRELAEFFFYQKVSLTIPGYSNPVQYLVDEGYLARAQFRQLFFENGAVITPEDIKVIERSFDIPDAILMKLARDEQRNLHILAEIENLAKAHKRIIVFAATVEHSLLLAAVLRTRGFHATSVTSRSTSVARETAIQSYKDDSHGVKIICNYGVLTTGFDAPKTSAAVIARPTKSLVLYSQMVGRAIRGPLAGGNRDAEIVTIVDQSLPGFRSIAEAFSHWEDVWE